MDIQDYELRIKRERRERRERLERERLERERERIRQRLENINLGYEAYKLRLQREKQQREELERQQRRERVRLEEQERINRERLIKQQKLKERADILKQQRLERERLERERLERQQRLIYEVRERERQRLERQRLEQQRLESLIKRKSLWSENLIRERQERLRRTKLRKISQNTEKIREIRQQRRELEERENVINNINVVLNNYRYRINNLPIPIDIIEDKNIRENSRRFFKVYVDSQKYYKNFVKDFFKFVNKLNIELRGSGISKEYFKKEILEIWNNFFRKTYLSFQPYYYVHVIKDGYLNNQEFKTLNMDTLTNISNMLRRNEIYEDTISGRQDNYDYNFIDQYFELKNTKGIILNFVLFNDYKRFSNVAFFNAVNTSKIDLLRYQIFNKKQLEDEITKKTNYLEYNCFVFGLIQSGLIRKRELKFAINHFNPNYVVKKEIKFFAEKYKICFVRHTRSKNLNKQGYYKSNKPIYYGKKYIDNRKIDFFDYDGHFVLREKIYINNKIKKELGLKQNKVFLDNLLPRLQEKGYFVKNHPLLLQVINNREKEEIFWENALKEIDNEQCDNNDIIDYEKEEAKAYFKQKTINNIFFADFEALLIKIKEFNKKYGIDDKLEEDNEEDIHTPFMLAYNSLLDENPKLFTQYNMIHMKKNDIFYRMLDDMIKENHLKCNKIKCIDPRCKSNDKEHNNIIYFHNIKYDLKLIEGFTGNKVIYFNKIESNGVIYSLTLCYEGVIFKLVDSHKYLSMSLDAVGKNYCKINKKVANFNGLYDKYTLKNIKQFDVDVNEFGLTESQKEDFAEFIHGDRFKHMDCYQYYLGKDVLTLREGMMTFNENIKSFTNMEIWDSLTISSLAYKYLNSRNSLKGIYTLSGNLREFCQKVISGGRCVTRHNRRYIVKKVLVDFDAVSLYPSAMDRLRKERIHLPIGKARVWKKSLELFKSKYWKGDINDKVYFECEIMITKVNIKRAIPFIFVNNYKRNLNDMTIEEWENYKGIKYNPNVGKTYTNSMKKLDGVWIAVDKLTVEDWEKFHGIEYKIRNIIYWKDEYEFDDKNHIGAIIADLYEARKEARKTDYNGPLQSAIKTMMLSIYGKLLLKPPSKSIKYKYYYNDKTKEDTDQWIIKNRKIIGDNIIKQHNNGQLEIKLDKLTYDHGNNVQLGALVLSMSRRIMNEVMALAEDLGIKIYYQDTDSMHIEADKIDLLSEEYYNVYGKVLIGSELGQFHSDFDMPGCKDVVSIKSIFLGKKMYIDRLMGIDKITGEKKYDYHIRMKGAGKNVIKKFCEDNDITPFKFYEMLYYGEVITLNLCDGGVKFDFSSIYIKTKKNFFRDVKATSKI